MSFLGFQTADLDGSRDTNLFLERGTVLNELSTYLAKGEALPFRVCFTPVLQRQCPEDMLIKGNVGLLLFPFSIWKEGLNMQYERDSICLEICP